MEAISFVTLPKRMYVDHIDSSLVPKLKKHKYNNNVSYPIYLTLPRENLYMTNVVCTYDQRINNIMNEEKYIQRQILLDPIYNIKK